MNRLNAAICFLSITAGLIGCSTQHQKRSQPVSAKQDVSSEISFENVSASAGLEFSLGAIRRSPLTILETAPGGAAFLDFDGDAKLDVLLVGPRQVALFRNEGGVRFRDVTARAGLPQNAYWMGCAAGDYDGDNDTDLVLTGYDRTALLRNEAGRFRDVTRESGISASGWTLSGVFADYDLDGKLDLYLTRYLEFNDRTPRLCQVGNIRSACGPEVYDPQRGLLYRNLGQSRFRDVTAEAGLAHVAGKGWSAILSDFNGDRYPDLYVANDMLPCDFYLNQQARFASTPSSVAYDANGHLQGAMGSDCADFNNDGLFDLLVTTYFAQPTSLYRNDGESLFTEVGMISGIGVPTTRYVGFGAVLFDADNDGWQDAFIANGHVRDNVREHDSGQDYAQPLQLFRNEQGRFSEVSASAGSVFNTPVVGRGVAAGDFDGDGRIDLLVCNLNGKALLLRNTTPKPKHWLRVRLHGASGNTVGIGAIVKIEAGSIRQVREVRSRGSVLSAQEAVAQFGLGDHQSVDELTVTWPRGTVSRLERVYADQEIEISEPRK